MSHTTIIPPNVKLLRHHATRTVLNQLLGLPENPSPPQLEA
jgi:hypothetical protein